MTPLRAFVGHSFTPDDADVVGKFLKYLDQLANLHPTFSWEHAEPAEPKVIDEKVMRLFAAKDLFIGICTKKERVIAPSLLKKTIFSTKGLKARDEDFVWKASDWIIQEIGLAIGRGLHVVLLVEQDLRSPGGLQGNLEHIEFDRDAPEKSFGKLVEMISALSPKGATAASAEPDARSSASEEKDTTRPPEGADWTTPKPDWKRRDYEFALMDLIAADDIAKATAISDQYLETELGAQEQNRKTWEAYKEYIFLSFGKGGSLTRLKKLSDENPESSEICTYLAKIYRQYQEHVKAALTYEKAATTVVSDLRRELKLLGNAARARQEAGDATAAFSLIARMKSKCADAGEGEAEVLIAERELAELSKEDEVLIGVMERLLDLDPADHDTRFTLAYEYSERGNDDLAILHYSRIPYAERSSVTWNNLGVSLDKLSLPAKSVDAYRRSEELGETLAMSNLAIKFIGSGFLPEAQRICDAALKIKDFHKNVGKTIGRLKDVPDDEERKEKVSLDKAKPISEFYKDFGRALARPTLTDFVARWQGPDCILDATLTKTTFVAAGSYERRSLGLLAMALAGTGGASSKHESTPTRYQIEYQGTARGRAIVANVVRRQEGEQTKPSSLLGSSEENPTVLMVVSDDGCEVRVLEKAKNSSPRFYSFKCQ